MNENTKPARRHFLRTCAGGGLAIAGLAASVPAVSASETRTLNLRNLHTRENLRIAFWSDGKLLNENILQLSHFLRDHRQNEAMLMDTNLFQQLWQIEQSLAHDCTFEIISAYRSPKTNAMLRATSDGVSRNSYHLRGQALDLRIIGYPTATLRKHALRLNAGGVGYYPRSKFVHIDTGPLRTWTS